MRPVHIFIIVLVLILLFGASRLPDIARNIGKSAKVLKEELTDLQADSQPSAAVPATPNVQPGSQTSGSDTTLVKNSSVDTQPSGNDPTNQQNTSTSAP